MKKRYIYAQHPAHKQNHDQASCNKKKRHPFHCGKRNIATRDLTEPVYNDGVKNLSSILSKQVHRCKGLTLVSTIFYFIRVRGIRDAIIKRNFIHERRTRFIYTAANDAII